MAETPKSVLKAPKVEDSTTQQAIEQIYEDLNKLYDSVHNETGTGSEEYEGKPGDIRCVQNHLGIYILEIRTESGWRAGKVAGMDVAYWPILKRESIHREPPTELVPVITIDPETGEEITTMQEQYVAPEVNQMVFHPGSFYYENYSPEIYEEGVIVNTGDVYNDSYLSYDDWDAEQKEAFAAMLTGNLEFMNTLRAPDWVSSWTSITNDTTYIIDHDLDLTDLPKSLMYWISEGQGTYPIYGPFWNLHSSGVNVFLFTKDKLKIETENSWIAGDGGAGAGNPDGYEFQTGYIKLMLWK